MDTKPLLEVTDLHVEFRQRGRRHGALRAVDGVSSSIRPGETVGLVGESGSGKSTIGRAILGLVPSSGGLHPAGRPGCYRAQAGSSASFARLVQAVFQDPFGSLNPSRTIGRTLSEPLEVQRNLDARQASSEVARLLQNVGLPPDAASRYPHGFSGGQRQRICIARALAPGPDLVICDEAVSALDLVTRAQVINLLAGLQRDAGLTLLFIAHDLSIVTHLSHRTVVLYRGRIMEQGPAEAIQASPLHPYTLALQAAVPLPVPSLQHQRRDLRKAAVASNTANAGQPPEQGCPFSPRCPHAADVCWSVRPADTVINAVTVACHRYAAGSGHPDMAAAGNTAPAA